MQISEVCREIKEILSPQEVAECLDLEYTERGGRVLVICPLHPDRNFGSAFLENGGFFHCYACPCSMDIITLAQKTKKVSFVEAVNLLAEVAGISVDATTEFSEEELLYIKNYRLNSEEIDVLKLNNKGPISLKKVFMADANLYKEIVLTRAKAMLEHYKEVKKNYGNRTSPKSFEIYEAYEGQISAETYNQIRRETTRRIIICEDIIGRFE